MMRRVLSVTVITLALASCASDEPTPAPPPAPTVAPAPPPPPAPPPVSTPQQPLTTSPPAKDACGAAEAQSLVGRPRREIPIPLRPALQRVACTTCPVTMDFNPRRLNFLYDATTGLIREVKCG